jgi:hypothetical protein
LDSEGVFVALEMEVKIVNRKLSTATLTPTRSTEATEELVGVLTAISVVSKRLARKLTMLEQRSNGKERDATDESTERT